MSSGIQNEPTARSDTAIDSYFSCLYTLREKVVSLIQHYHAILLQKMDCDVGNLVACNTEAFQNQLADVFTQLNETELQLNSLEAWAGLPPECFASIPSTPSGASFDSDQISFEAQTLVELVRRLQVGLRSMVSKTSSHTAPPQTTSSDIAMDESCEQPTNALGPSQTKPRSTVKIPTTHVEPQLSTTAVSSGTGGQVPSQHGYTTISPQLPDGVSYTGTEEGSAVTQHGGRAPYQSPTSHSGPMAPIRSPITDRRQPENTEHYSGALNPNRTASLAPYPATASSLYGSTAAGPYSTGGQIGYPDMSSQPHSSRLTVSGYPESGSNVPSTFRPDYQNR